MSENCEQQNYPILNGPSVPWSVMLPHELRAKRNHGGQSLSRLAERGGLDFCEAYAIVFDVDPLEVDKLPRNEVLRRWCAFAENCNSKYVHDSEGNKA